MFYFIKEGKQKMPLKGHFKSLAENVGFEPTVPCGTTVFKTAAIDHSANSPWQK
jgi:hypothetical protein